MSAVPSGRPRAARLATGRRAAPGTAGGPRIVALGGGTGLPVLLRGLRHAFAAEEAAAGAPAPADRVVAIVTVADDGGSSGRLRRAYGVLPPGDIRNCLLALAEGDGTLAALFGYRFNGHSEMTGHNLGNLILAALSQMECQFDRAVQRASDMLGIRGRVLPATSTAVGLVAQFDDGTCLDGESRIATVGRRITRVRLRPARASALPQALEAIAAADCIVLGPGSLYTSVLPALLVDGMAEAIARSGARVALVMNIMTEPGETDGLSPEDHLLALRAHVPGLPVDDVILNDVPVPAPLRQRYAAEGARPLAVDPAALRRLGCGIWAGNLLASGDKVRHDPHKLARAVLEVARRTRPRGDA